MAEEFPVSVLFVTADKSHDGIVQVRQNRNLHESESMPTREIAAIARAILFKILLLPCSAMKLLLCFKAFCRSPLATLNGKPLPLPMSL